MRPHARTIPAVSPPPPCPQPPTLLPPPRLDLQGQVEVMSKDLMAGLSEVDALIQQLPGGGGSEADEVAQASRRWAACHPKLAACCMCT